MNFLFCFHYDIEPVKEIFLSLPSYFLSQSCEVLSCMDAGRQAVDVVGTEGSEKEKFLPYIRKVKKSELFYKRYSVPIFSFYLLALSPGWPKATWLQKWQKFGLMAQAQKSLRESQIFMFKRIEKIENNLCYLPLFIKLNSEVGPIMFSWSIVQGRNPVTIPSLWTEQILKLDTEPEGMGDLG